MRAVFVFAVTVVATLVLSSAAAARPLYTALMTVGADPTDPMSYDTIRRAGASHAFLWLNWRSVAPDGERKPADFNEANPDSRHYRWRRFDEEVRLAVQNGLTPIVAIHLAPDYAEGTGRGIEGTVRPDPGELALFAKAAARRYSGSFVEADGDPSTEEVPLPRVRYWQIWNEPNIPGFLSPQFQNGRLVSPALYRRMLNASYWALKEVDRSNVVVAPGLSPYGKRSRPRKPGPMRFMRDLLCMSDGPPHRRVCRARSYLDIWAHHPYACGGPNTRALSRDDAGIADLPEMRRLLVAAIRAGNVVPRSNKPMWVTELGWDTDPPDPGSLSLSRHARYVSEGLYRMWQAGVTLVTWFQLVDLPYAPLSRFQAGLYFIDGTPKQRSINAFRFPFVAFAARGKITVWGRVPPLAGAAVWPAGETVVVERKTSSGWRSMRSFRTNSVGIFSARFRSSLRKGWLRARLVDRRATSDYFSLTRPYERRICPFTN